MSHAVITGDSNPNKNTPVPRRTKAEDLHSILTSHQGRIISSPSFETILCCESNASGFQI